MIGCVGTQAPSVAHHSVFLYFWHLVILVADFSPHTHTAHRPRFMPGGHSCQPAGSARSCACHPWEKSGIFELSEVRNGWHKWREYRDGKIGYTGQLDGTADVGDTFMTKEQYVVVNLLQNYHIEGVLEMRLLNLRL
ncbi:hypothetical protein Pelo_19511 [Pelomyxa schiedti]|nr:hypothetical protein Pelo_19511 [Pelomyxa schiedti]